MANFVEVPAQAIESHLAAKGFVRGVQREEVVYVRASQRNPDVKIKVYTSVRVGRPVVRGAGKDAVRVCVVFDNGRRSFGIGKFPSVPRVHSVESVLRRTDERIRAAKLRAVEWMRGQDAGSGPARPSPAGTDRFNEEWAAHKAEFSRLEAEQEELAFMSDPDTRAVLDADDRGTDLDDREPPHGFREEDADPPSEQPGDHDRHRGYGPPSGTASANGEWTAHAWYCGRGGGECSC